VCERERLRVCAILAGNTQRAVLHIHAVLSLSLSLSLSHTHTHTLKFSLVIQTKLYSIFMNLSLSHTHTHSLSLSLSRPRARALSLSCLITGEICSYALLHASLRPLQLGADACLRRCNCAGHLALALALTLSLSSWRLHPLLDATSRSLSLSLSSSISLSRFFSRALSPSLPSTCEHASALFLSHTFDSRTLYGYLG